MALFDRRLLAYFDDGLGAGGSTTLLDRIIDYQKDLHEIEEELAKYQLLLGSHQVQFRHRDRDGWISKNRVQKTVQERYRKVAQAMGQVDDPEDVAISDAPQANGDGRRGSFSRKQAATSRGSRDSVASTQSRRPSQKNVAGETTTVWVQIDTITNLPAPRSRSYVVRVAWQGGGGDPTETEEKPSERGSSGEEKCVIRQQLKLVGNAGSQIVIVSVYGKEDGQSVGECQIDISDSYNHEVQLHPLNDKNGRPVGALRGEGGAAVRLRLTNPNGNGGQTAPAASSQRQGARGSQRMSTFPTPGAEPASATGAADRGDASSTHRHSQQDLPSMGSSDARHSTGGAQDRIDKDASARRKSSDTGSRPPVATVTQDPVVSSQRRPSRDLSHSESSAPQGSAKTAAAGAVVGAGAAVVAGKAANAPSDGGGSLEASPSRGDETPALTTPAQTPGAKTELSDEMIEEEEEESFMEEEEEEEEYEEGEEEEDGTEDEAHTPSTSAGTQRRPQERAPPRP